jgi:hypothetical protein
VVGVFQLGFQGSAWTDTGTFDGSGGFLGLYLPYGSSLVWFIAMGIAIARWAGKQEAGQADEATPGRPATPALAAQ